MRGKRPGMSHLFFAELDIDQSVRPTIHMFAQPPPSVFKRRPPPEPNSNASSSNSNGKRQRRSRSPVKPDHATDENGIINIPDSDAIEEDEGSSGREDGLPELNEFGK